MLCCNDPQFEVWHSDSNSGLRQPKHVRLMADGVELCNDVQLVEWQANPVQVRLCPECWVSGCASGGYVDVTRLGDRVLWCPVIFDEVDDFARHRYRLLDALLEHGGAFFSSTLWEQWHKKFNIIPAFEALPQMRRRNAMAVWLAELRNACGFFSTDFLLDRLNEQSICSMRSSLESALDVLTRINHWFGEALDRPIEGSLVRSSALKAQPEEIYVETEGTPAWTPYLQRGEEIFVAFGPDWVIDRAVPLDES